MLELNRETDKSGVTLPDNWKPSLQPFNHPLNNNDGDKPVVIGSDVSVSSSTVTEINFEPGKNAPVFVGVKSTDVPPNVWLTAEDIVAGLDQTGLDNETMSTASLSSPSSLFQATTTTKTTATTTTTTTTVTTVTTTTTTTTAAAAEAAEMTTRKKAISSDRSGTAKTDRINICPNRKHGPRWVIYWESR